MEKSIENIDVITCKLAPISTNVTNYRLKISKKEKQKREKMVKK